MLNYAAVCKIFDFHRRGGDHFRCRFSSRRDVPQKNRGKRDFER